ncbi:MAG: DUF1428 domain-containing protein [Hyphomicrobiales bacterium]|nr:DUF1428 domain-containing protein [Hyphomicrobiales bacterium]
MAYIDGVVCAVPTANKETYKAHAEEAADEFKKYGALSVVECWGNEVPDGKVTSMLMAVQCKEDETVVFSWITWPSKGTRDAAWAKMMEESEFLGKPFPYDGSRMIFGGFDVIVDA